MRWKVKVDGDSYEFQTLEKSLSKTDLSLIDISLSKDKQGFYLESKWFESCSSHEEVRDVASKILAVLNGATKLALREHSIISLSDEIVEVKEDGRKITFATYSDSIGLKDSFSVSVKDSDGNLKQEIHPTDEVPKWLSIGLKDESVKKAFRLFGQEQQLTWVNLYRIYEVIEKDVGELDKVTELGVTKSKIKEFKHTANSPGALGDASRHGKESTQAPSHPLSIFEARALIETLFHSWLRVKDSRNNAVIPVTI